MRDSERYRYLLKAIRETLDGAESPVVRAAMERLLWMDENAFRDAASFPAPPLSPAPVPWDMAGFNRHVAGLNHPGRDGR